MTKCQLCISRVPLEKERWGFLVYDLSEGVLIREISDYAQVLLYSRHSSPLTVEQGMNHLVEFWKFLSENTIRLNAVSDRVIEKFRDSNLKKVQAAPAHRGILNHAKATVNLKLYRIYDWLVWLQSSNRLPVGTVGLRGLVTAIQEAPYVGSARKPVKRRSVERRFPLLFRVPNANAKHNAPATVVTDSHMTELVELLMRGPDPFLAQRNVLFADTAETAGFRRGSVCSLDVRQFDREQIAKSEGEFLVRPHRQKFNKSNTFGISLTLAYRILDFIEQYWEPWVKRHKVPASIHRHRLFLSARGGRPITERAMTQIISAAFRELGFEKGIGPHTLRGKFTSETADDELAERLELGLDTSNRSIAAAIAPKLGHSDPDQFYRYASASQSKRARIEREGRITELKALRLENGELKGENERLRTALAATPSGGERNSRKKTLL